jgi:hypothetical protein
LGDIYFRYLDLPTSIRSFIREDPDGGYNVYLNARLSDETLRRAAEHERAHAERGDLRRTAEDLSDVEDME